VYCEVPAGSKLQNVCTGTKTFPGFAYRGFARGEEKTHMRVREVQASCDNARESLGPEIP